MARDALIATHGGLSLEWCAVICHISPMALYRVICAFGQHSLVTVLTRCGLPLPTYILADEKHSRCLAERVYLPTIVVGRVLWHLGIQRVQSAAAFTESYGVFQRAALEHEPSYQVRGALTDGFDSTTKSMRTLFPGARLGFCLRHALNKLPDKLIGVSASVRQGLRSKFHALLHRCRQRKACGWWHWASASAPLPLTSPRRWEKSMASVFASGSRTSCAVKSGKEECSNTRGCTGIL